MPDRPASQPAQSAPALPGAHPLFDPERFIPTLDAALRGLTDPRDIRTAAVAHLAPARADAMADVLAGKGGRWYRRIGNVDWLRRAWEGEGRRRR